jgi:hypothetical protein
MPLRETTQVIIQAMGVLEQQGRAEETSVRGRWRLLTAHREQGRDRPVREAESTHT